MFRYVDRALKEGKIVVISCSPNTRLRVAAIVDRETGELFGLGSHPLWHDALNRAGMNFKENVEGLAEEHRFVFPEYSAGIEDPVDEIDCFLLFNGGRLVASQNRQTVSVAIVIPVPPIPGDVLKVAQLNPGEPFDWEQGGIHFVIIFRDMHETGLPCVEVRIVRVDHDIDPFDIIPTETIITETGESFGAALVNLSAAFAGGKEKGQTSLDKKNTRKGKTSSRAEEMNHIFPAPDKVNQPRRITTEPLRGEVLFLP